MIHEAAIIKALELLPFPLRSAIYSEVQRRYLEAKAADIEEQRIEREIVLTILQELFTNLVEPLEMIDAILQSKSLRDVGQFKIEFSEISFDRQFHQKGKEFIQGFWSLAREIGVEEEIRPKKRPRNYERKYEG